MSFKEKALKLHEKGKIEIKLKTPIKNKQDLSLSYTPGVAEPCLEIKNNKDLIYKYTIKQNTIAIITDGSAVLGLGNIGAEASIPVMEGKAALFKEFADIDAFPICLSTQDPDEIVNITKKISPIFGGINLEDISSPRCFEIEDKLKNELNIPVFHDDQHGTAIVVLAALINSCKILDKDIKKLKIIINGAGAAGIAITKMLTNYGISDILLADSKGILYKCRDNLNAHKEKISETINHPCKNLKIEDRKNCKLCIQGDLSVGLKNRDVFIGVSVGNILTKDMIKTMNKDPIIFAMANPTPEISPEEALKAGTSIVATGRSDYNNQINNVLAFPGVFKGALEANATQINEEMKLAAALALADSTKDLSKEKIIPDPFERNTVKDIAKAVKEAAIKTKVIR